MVRLHRSGRMVGVDALGVAAVGFVAANLLHTADHVRQGIGRLDWEILAAGTGLSVLAVVTLVLALRRHPRASLVAAVVGIGGAAGITSSHIAPYWGVLSDPYPALHVDLLSWIVVLLEIGAALALGVAGLADLRRR